MKLTDYITVSGVTPHAFAKRCGLPASTIHRVLHGQRTPTLRVVSRIEEASGGAVKAADFMDHVEAAQ